MPDLHDLAPVVDAEQAWHIFTGVARRRRTRRRLVALLATVAVVSAGAVVDALSIRYNASEPTVNVSPSTTVNVSPSTAPVSTVPLWSEPLTFSVFNQAQTVDDAGNKRWLVARSPTVQVYVYTTSECGLPTPSNMPSVPRPCSTNLDILCLEMTTTGPPVPYLSTTGDNTCASISTIFGSISTPDPRIARLSQLHRFAPETASWGYTQGLMVHGQPARIWGVVPDVVTRVTYAGRDVPITNNGFVIPYVAPLADRRQGVPLYFYIGGCRKQVEVAWTMMDGVANWTVPHRQPTCETTTTPSSTS